MSRVIYLFRKAVPIILIFSVLIGVASVSASITEGYFTDDEGLQPGFVVSLSTESTTEKQLVERATDANIQRFVGVATTVEESLVTISNSAQSIYVKSGGEAEVFVVDDGGEIRQGDQLTLSVVRGMLTKANDSSPYILATALADADFSDADEHTVTQNGESKTVKVQKVRANINTQVLFSPGQDEGDSPLAELGRNITGRDVGELRVLIALIIFVLVMIAEGGIIYGAVSSAITSLGRNPLASKFIRRELVRVLFVAMVVLFVGISSIYAILWV